MGDAVNNFLGGLGIASTFLIDPRAGVIAWVDFAVLVHGGWPRHQALLLNALSALTFPVGGVLAYLASWHVDVAGLVLLGAGNFIYIAASDLIPEIKAQGADLRTTASRFALFTGGLLLMFSLAYWFER